MQEAKEMGLAFVSEEQVALLAPNPSPPTLNHPQISSAYKTVMVPWSPNWLNNSTRAGTQDFH